MTENTFHSPGHPKSGYEIQQIENILRNTLYTLDNLRRTLTHEEWKHFCTTQTTNFLLHKLLLRDPFTKKAFEMQDNSIMDPFLTDYLLDYTGSPDKFNNPIGLKIFNFIYHSDPAAAIRHRQKHIARLIDKISGESAQPISILSVYSASIKKADLSVVIKNKTFKEFRVLVEDKLSLQIIDKFCSHLGIIPKQIAIEEWMSQQPIIGHYDFVYSAGLFDQQNSHSVRKVLNKMFELVKGNGFLLITNFRLSVPNTLFRTYLEAFANWFIHYRSDEELIDLFSDINPEKIDHFQLTIDPYCNIAYILVRKRSS